jgi:hypothetical protein
MLSAFRDNENNEVSTLVAILISLAAEQIRPTLRNAAFAFAELL